MTIVLPHVGHGRIDSPRVFYTLGEIQVGNAYAIYPVGGTYTYTGTAATLGVGLIPSGGSYSYTGTAAILGVGLIPSGGTYTYTGTAATLGVGIPLGSGSYSYTGTNPTLGIGLIPDSGSYSVSGTAISTSQTRNLNSSSYSFNGTNPTLGIGLIPDSGVFTYTGTNPTLNVSLSQNLAPGIYNFLGTLVNLQFVSSAPQTGGRQITEEEVEEEYILRKIDYPEKLRFPNSTDLEAVLYDKNSGEMQIRFKSGGTYKYQDVTPGKFKGFRRAKSAGSYFHNKIKPKYPGKKM